MLKNEYLANECYDCSKQNDLLLTIKEGKEIKQCLECWEKIFSPEKMYFKKYFVEFWGVVDTVFWCDFCGIALKSYNLNYINIKETKEINKFICKNCYEKLSGW